jgi:sulfur-oxidizing protein SoxB
MARVAGLKYTLDHRQSMGSRISNLQLHGKPLVTGKTYKLASWAPVAEGVIGEPIWDVVIRSLRQAR